jgi:hypothetical protein
MATELGKICSVCSGHVFVKVSVYLIKHHKKRKALPVAGHGYP